MITTGTELESQRERAASDATPVMTELVKRLCQSLSVIACLWSLFSCIYYVYPYIRPGAEVVYQHKVTIENTPGLFSKHAKVRVLAFGDSQVLAGFRPAEFDSQLKENRIQVRSYNLGEPGESQFLKHLQSAVHGGNIPSIVLLTKPWMPRDAKRVNAFHYLSDDDGIMSNLFPFRNLPRDLVLFTMLARNRGGFGAFYDRSRAQVRQMELDRGWYFIAGLSTYTDHRLPAEYREDADTPETVDARSFTPTGDEFQKLRELASRYHIAYVYIPTYRRIGERHAPPAINTKAVADLSGFKEFTIAGPDYWLYPNSAFSDPKHLNPDGARRYTDDLATLLLPMLEHNGQVGMRSVE